MNGRNKDNNSFQSKVKKEFLIRKEKFKNNKSAQWVDGFEMAIINKSEKYEKKKDMSETQELFLDLGDPVPLENRKVLKEQKNIKKDEKRKEEDKLYVMMRSGDSENSKKSPDSKKAANIKSYSFVEKIQNFKVKSKIKLEGIKGGFQNILSKGNPINENEPVSDLAEGSGFSNKEAVSSRIITTVKSNWLTVLILSLITVVFIVGGVNSLSGGYGEEEIVPVFTKALKSEDTDLLTSIVKTNQNEKPLTEKQLIPFIRLYNNNDEYALLVDKALSDEVKTLADHTNEDQFINIVEKKDINPFTKKYLVSINLIEAKTDENDIQLAVSGSPIRLTEEPVKILPGLYEAHRNMNILQLTNDLQIDHQKIVNNVVVVSFDNMDAEITNQKTVILPGEKSIYISDAKPNDMVFVNGKNANMTVSEINSFGSNNLSAGDKITIVSQEPWGYSFSDTQEITGNSNYSMPTQIVNEEVAEDIIDLIKTTLLNDQQAFLASDPSKLTTLTGTALVQSTTLITMNKSFGQGYIRKYEDLQLDMDSLKINGNNNYEGYVGGFITKSEGKFRLSESPETADIDRGEKEKVGFHFNYDRNKDRWMMNLWGTTTKELGEENLREVEFK